MSPNPTQHKQESIQRLRELCLALPDVSERLSHGEPTWFVAGKRMFVTFANHHHDDILGFWCAAPPGIQEALIATSPDQYFRPPYVGGRGWIGVRLDVPVDWNEIEATVEDAYDTVAPRRASSSRWQHRSLSATARSHQTKENPMDLKLARSYVAQTAGVCACL